jgi:hypothetical protein
MAYYEYNRSQLHPSTIFPVPHVQFGAHGGVVVKALRYKPAGHGFDSRWCHWNFGARGGVVVKALRYKPAVAGSIPDGVIGIFQ